MSKVVKSQPAAAPVAAPAPVAAKAPVQYDPKALHYGVELGALPRHVATMGPVGKATPAVLAQQVQLGKVQCKVRAPHCQKWWASVTETLAKNKGKATLEVLAAAQVPPHFARYAVRNGWLAEVKA
jgi:hypothetical protein